MKELSKFGVIILAGGRGNRMGGKKPKVLRLLGGKPLLHRTLDLVIGSGFRNIVVVVASIAEEIKESLVDAAYKVNFATQEEPLGTGHAVAVGLKAVPKGVEEILVLYGDDSSLYGPKTIIDFINYHSGNKNKATFLTVSYKKPISVGGLKRDKFGNVIGVLTMDKLLEDKVTPIEVACGAFCFDRTWLSRNLSLLSPGSSGEIPLTGLIQIGARYREYVKTYRLENEKEWNSVNTPSELRSARRKNKQLLNQ